MVLHYLLETNVCQFEIMAYFKAGEVTEMAAHFLLLLSNVFAMAFYWLC